MDIHLNKLGKITQFFKRYGYYAILGVTVCAVFVAALLIAPTNDDALDVDSNVIVFSSPVANASVLKGFSDSALQFNQTLNKWEAHKAIDFVAETGTNVVACYDGTVANVYSNDLEGGVVVIDHGNNLKSVYKSLDTNILVEQGEEVEKGQVIGASSDSAMSEADDGAHVHFEVWKEGQKVDPEAYLLIEDK